MLKLTRPNALATLRQNFGVFLSKILPGKKSEAGKIMDIVLSFCQPLTFCLAEFLTKKQNFASMWPEHKSDLQMFCLMLLLETNEKS